MSLQLPTELLDRLDQGGQPVCVEDPRSHEEYILVPRKEYELLRDRTSKSTRQLPSLKIGADGEEWSEAMNARRFVLVHREIEGTLTSEEVVELQHLQDQMLAFRRKVAPYPLEELREIHQQLLEKVRQSSRGA